MSGCTLFQTAENPSIATAVATNAARAPTPRPSAASHATITGATTHSTFRVTDQSKTSSPAWWTCDSVLSGFTLRWWSWCDSHVSRSVRERFSQGAFCVQCITYLCSAYSAHVPDSHSSPAKSAYRTARELLSEPAATATASTSAASSQGMATSRQGAATSRQGAAEPAPVYRVATRTMTQASATAHAATLSAPLALATPYAIAKRTAYM